MNNCRLCGSDGLEQAFDFGAQPIASNFLVSEQQYLPLFEFTMASCRDCGFLQMTKFPEAALLYDNYFTLSSWKPQPHAEQLIRVMTRLYGLDERSRIFEIGSNDGSFLELLKSKGFDHIFGVEPTNDASSVALAKGLPVTRSFYDSQAIDCLLEQFPDADCVVSRQVIEHIANLTDFMTCIRSQLNVGGGLVLEFPDTSMNYEQLDYAFWEQHVNYFTINTIQYLLSRHGFRILHYETALFSGKCLMVFAVKEKEIKPTLSGAINEVVRVTGYVEKFPNFKLELKKFVEQKCESGKLVMYGCGARSSNFINLLGLSECFSCFVDDQKEKQRKICPGNNLPILDSAEVVLKNTYIALGVNSESESAVIKKHRLKRFFSVLPPSHHLPDFWRVSVE